MHARAEMASVQYLNKSGAFRKNKLKTIVYAVFVECTAGR
jgi:hypothetical protein